MKIGIEEITFDAAHYTPGSTEKCKNLHGHTFSLHIEIIGEVKKEDGMIMDFTILKKIAKEVIEEYDHSIILPEKDKDKTIISGNFNTKFKYIQFPHATTEFIALSIAREIYNKVKMPLKIRLYEGKHKYAEVEVRDDEALATGHP